MQPASYYKIEVHFDKLALSVTIGHGSKVQHYGPSQAEPSQAKPMMGRFYTCFFYAAITLSLQSSFFVHPLRPKLRYESINVGHLLCYYEISDDSIMNSLGILSLMYTKLNTTVKITLLART